MGCWPTLAGGYPGPCVALVVVETTTRKTKRLILFGSRCASNLVPVKVQQIFLVGFWLAGAAAPSGLHAELSPEKLYKKVLPSVMTLEVESQSGEKFVGSAVLALADDCALTAWHVVADARTVWAVFADGQRVRVVGYLDQDDRRDVALLKLEKPMLRRRAILSHKLESIASRAYVIGAPKGYDFSISDGLISQTRIVDGVLQYQLSCPISPGNSGSPIFNQRGEVIGIASWTKSDAQNVSFAIPTQEFTRLDVSERPRTWPEVVGSGGAVPDRMVKSRQVSDGAASPAGATDEGSYAAFQQRLNESVGQSVTIVLQEADRTNTYTFTVK